MGGRVYERVERRTQSDGSSNRSTIVGKVVGALCLLACFFVLSWAEWDMFLTIGCLPEAEKLTTSYFDHAQVDSLKHKQLVHAMTSTQHAPVVVGPPLRDPLFNFVINDNEENVVILKRVTEYCQWVEVEQRNQVKIGKDPDYCSKSTNRDASTCVTTDCSGKGQGSCHASSTCCSWVQGADIYKTEISYLYHKGWRNNRIPSLLFDNPVAYYNPQRDPAPGVEFISAGLIDIAGGRFGAEDGLKIYPTDARPILTGFNNELIGKRRAAEIGQEALNQGFSEVSHTHFYSRKPKNGWDNPILHSIASYLVDGVIDVNSIGKATGVEGLLSSAGLEWLTKGTCDAGDVRVHFETRSLPAQMSVLGEQRAPNLIVPHVYSNGATLLMLSDRSLSVKGLVESTRANQEWKTNLYRFLSVALLGIGLFMISSIFENCNVFLICFSLLVSIFATFESLIWLYFYGAPSSLVSVSFCIFAVVGGYFLATLLRTQQQQQQKEKTL